VFSARSPPDLQLQEMQTTALTLRITQINHKSLQVRTHTATLRMHAKYIEVHRVNL